MARFSSGQIQRLLFILFFVLFFDLTFVSRKVESSTNPNEITRSNDIVVIVFAVI